MYKPPTVPCETPKHTYSYGSDIPSGIKEGDSIVIGIDEAGRGPLIGPMVYSLAYCSTNFANDFLPKCEFADSKVLNDNKRRGLMKVVCDGSLKSEIGFRITALSALDISNEMLRPSGHVINLNEQAHTCTSLLIRSIVDQMKEFGVKIKSVYIDTVGPPVSYRSKLRAQFTIEEIGEIYVEKKADSIYPIVSAASVIAKVTRDIVCESYGEEWGSGYPSDPNTIRWVRDSMNKFWGWNEQIRYSWGTARTALEKNDGIEMDWEHELVKKHKIEESVVKDKYYIGKEWFF